MQGSRGGGFNGQKGVVEERPPPPPLLSAPALHGAVGWPCSAETFSEGLGSAPFALPLSKGRMGNADPAYPHADPRAGALGVGLCRDGRCAVVDQASPKSPALEPRFASSGAKAHSIGGGRRVN